LGPILVNHQESARTQSRNTGPQLNLAEIEKS